MHVLLDLACVQYFFALNTLRYRQVSKIRYVFELYCT